MNSRKCKYCYICKEKFKDKHANYKKNWKVRGHWHYAGEYRGAAYSICNLKYSVLEQMHIVLYNGSNYDYHFINHKRVSWRIWKTI